MAHSSKGAIPRPLSRLPAPKSYGLPAPKSSGLPAPKSYGLPAPKSSIPKFGKQLTKQDANPRRVEREKEYELPPLSILLPKPINKGQADLEKLKKKMIRRNSPEGEDLKKIKEIIRGTKGQEISVQEFVGLVSSYTGDNGFVLNNVMSDELTSFRKMAQRIYETMTQDVEDVLTNEHIQLSTNYEEKKSAYTDKMMRTIDEIFGYASNFDFDKYYKEVGYLDRLFPVVNAHEPDPEEAELERRQEAYHRIQWLRAEGQRFAEENEQLQKRVNELKRLQCEERENAARAEALAEQEKEDLEATQADLQEQLEEINEDLQKSIVENETQLELEHSKSMRAMPKPAKQRKSVPRAVPKSVKGLPWNVTTARQLEEDAGANIAHAELSRTTVSSVPSAFQTNIKKKKKKSRLKPPSREPRDRSPFHYSPPRSPERSEARASSPFHYSPPKSPPRERSPSPRGRTSARDEPPQIETTRIEKTTTILEPTGGRQHTGRQSFAPRDTWSGFN